jgi:hypothetical protein
MNTHKQEERATTSPRPVRVSEGVLVTFGHVIATNFMFTFFLTWVREGRHHHFILNAQDVPESAIPNEPPPETGEKGGTVMTSGSRRLVTACGTSEEVGLLPG